MPRYKVVILRSEWIEYEIDAESPDDARARYLADGEEVDSETTDLSIDSVEELPADYISTNTDTPKEN
jgi:hypothetical protein